jgi:hypothetical protein
MEQASTDTGRIAGEVSDVSAVLTMFLLYTRRILHVS